MTRGVGPATSPGAAASGRSFESRDPRTGEVLGHYPVHTVPEVRAAVAAASRASRWWVSLGFGGRRAVLDAWRALLLAHLDELAALITAETGKPRDDARLEVVLTVDHLAWAARNARRVLGRRSVRPGVLMSNQAATLAYPPFGVVGVVGPWNYPMFTPMGSIAYALAAGNAVVFKPSELAPGVAHELSRLFGRAAQVSGRTSGNTAGPTSGGAAGAGTAADVLSVVTGFGDTGEALCRAGIGKLAFTGSTTTAKRVMATCAENLVPVLLECGGKDALIVDSDADLAAAADAAVWGGMANAGQTCVGVERVYVVESVAEEFLRAVVERAGALRVGDRPDADYGPMTLPAQLDVVAGQVRDATARGARPVLGGPDSVRAPYVGPVVLTDVPEDSTVMTEETFGPVLAVNRVADLDEAVDRANASGFGLGAAVFSARRGERTAARLRCGMVSINSVIAFAAVPALPFGGVGASGFGRIHGEDGLREFARAQSVTRQRFSPPIAVTSFSRGPKAMGRLVGLVKAIHRR